jgi:short-subunit dehydrogenase
MMEFSAGGSALITGASSGIGAAYADRLARRGYDLILVARNCDRLDATAGRIAWETGANVQIIPADLNDPQCLHHLAHVLRVDPSIRMLVNNAGMGLVSPTLASDVDTLQTMIGLNVTALTHLCQAAAASFVERGAGNIINIGSALALAPEAYNGVYAASKAYVLAFSQALRNELADSGVRVQVVMPGATATDFWTHAGKPVAELPPQIVMNVEDLVDAAMAGFDLGEFVTIPALPDLAQWQSLEAARLALRPHLSLKWKAPRYRGAV